MTLRRICMITCLAALSVALMLAEVAAGEVSREGLIAEWHFNGDAEDTRRNANHGVVNGAVFVDGKFDKALSFKGGNDFINGISDYVSVAMDFPETDYTYMFWFKTSSSTTGISSVKGSSVKKPDLVVLNDRQVFLSNGNICHRLWMEEVICSSEKNYADNDWHQAAIVVRSGAGQKIYIDGVEVASG